MTQSGICTSIWALSVCNGREYKIIYIYNIYIKRYHGIIDFSRNWDTIWYVSTHRIESIVWIEIALRCWTRIELSLSSLDDVGRRYRQFLFIRILRIRSRAPNKRDTSNGFRKSKPLEARVSRGFPPINPKRKCPWQPRCLIVSSTRACKRIFCSTFKISILPKRDCIYNWFPLFSIDTASPRYKTIFPLGSLKSNQRHDTSIYIYILPTTPPVGVLCSYRCTARINMHRCTRPVILYVPYTAALLQQQRDRRDGRQMNLDFVCIARTQTKIHARATLQAFN